MLQQPAKGRLRVTDECLWQRADHGIRAPMEDETSVDGMDRINVVLFDRTPAVQCDSY